MCCVIRQKRSRRLKFRWQLLRVDQPGIERFNQEQGNFWIYNNSILKKGLAHVSFGVTITPNIFDNRIPDVCFVSRMFAKHTFDTVLHLQWASVLQVG